MPFSDNFSLVLVRKNSQRITCALRIENENQNSTMRDEKSNKRVKDSFKRYKAQTSFSFEY